MQDWLYLASDATSSLPDTISMAVDHSAIWRAAKNKDDHFVANVRHLKVGDRLFLFWRGDSSVYLRCVVAEPLDPADPSVVIDRVTGEHATALVAAGYPASGDGTVELIRLAHVEPWHVPLGERAPQNAIQRVSAEQAELLRVGGSLPDQALTSPQPTSPRRGSTAPATASSPPPAKLGAEEVAPWRIEAASKDADRAFDAYLMVDWSSSSKPVEGGDSIWIAAGAWSADGFAAAAPINVSTRQAAEAHIVAEARRLQAEGKRVLIGLDFAFGYPAGFARALGLPADVAPWLAVHRHFASGVQDDARNAHNRDAFASGCNERIAPAGPGPFWGCAGTRQTDHLRQQRVGVFTFPYADGLREWRVTEERVKHEARPQSVWKLNSGISVGGQTILGLKYLHQMATSLGGKRWPFDTGWAAPPTGQGVIWFAEIFPSLLRFPEWAGAYDTQRDRTQVQSCVRHAAELDAAGFLRRALETPDGLDANSLSRVTSEEGWILFAPPPR